MQAVHVAPLAGQLALKTAADTPFKPLLLPAHPTNQASWGRQLTHLAVSCSRFQKCSAAAATGPAYASATNSRLAIGRAPLSSSHHHPAASQQHRSQSSVQYSKQKVQVATRTKSEQLVQAADTTTVKPVGNGLPLLFGLRQLPRGAHGLKAYKVLLAKNHKAVIGTVTEV